MYGCEAHTGKYLNAYKVMTLQSKTNNFCENPV